MTTGQFAVCIFIMVCGAGDSQASLAEPHHLEPLRSRRSWRATRRSASRAAAHSCTARSPHRHRSLQQRVRQHAPEEVWGLNTAQRCASCRALARRSLRPPLTLPAVANSLSGSVRAAHGVSRAIGSALLLLRGAPLWLPLLPQQPLPASCLPAPVLPQIQ